MVFVGWLAIFTAVGTVGSKITSHANIWFYSSKTQLNAVLHKTTTPSIPHGELGQCSASSDEELLRHLRPYSGFGKPPSRWISVFFFNNEGTWA